MIIILEKFQLFLPNGLKNTRRIHIQPLICQNLTKKMKVFKNFEDIMLNQDYRGDHPRETNSLRKC